MFFALAMMACAAILGASSTQIDNICDLTAFTYTLHVFLALCGMFFVMILFSRKGIYHPEDLAKAKQAGNDDLGNDKPIVAAVLICLMISGYATYQIVTRMLANGTEQAGQAQTQCMHLTQKPAGKATENQ